MQGEASMAARLLQNKAGLSSASSLVEAEVLGSQYAYWSTGGHGRWAGGVRASSGFMLIIYIPH